MRPPQYLTAQESALMVRQLGNPAIPEDLLTKVRTSSTVDAPPRGGKAPLVLLSPGFTLPRETLYRAAMLADRRIDAGAMLDGAYYLPVSGLDRPFLQFGEPSHNMFTDQLLLVEQAGITLPGLEIDPLRGIRLSQAYLTAFVDVHLRGVAQPLLAGPSACFPEVRFWNPA